MIKNRELASSQANSSTCTWRTAEAKSSLREQKSPSTSQTSKESRSHELFALRINDADIAGLPGEPFGTYSMNLRRRFPDHKVIACEECNGYLAYIPTAPEFPEGGYEVCASPFDQRVENALLDKITKLTAEVLAAN